MEQQFTEKIAQDSADGEYIFYRDAIEPEFEHLDKFLDSEGVFIDVGANTGIYTIKAAKHFDNNGTVLRHHKPKLCTFLF